MNLSAATHEQAGSRDWGPHDQEEVDRHEFHPQAARNVHQPSAHRIPVSLVWRIVDCTVCSMRNLTPTPNCSVQLWNKLCYVLQMEGLPFFCVKEEKSFFGLSDLCTVTFGPRAWGPWCQWQNFKRPKSIQIETSGTQILFMQKEKLWHWKKASSLIVKIGRPSAFVFWRLYILHPFLDLP